MTLILPRHYRRPLAAVGGGPVNSCDYDGTGDYLTKTFGAGDSAGKKWSFFTWMKPTGSLSGEFPTYFSAGYAATNGLICYINGSGALTVWINNTVYTSTSSPTINTWHSVGVVADTDNATASERFKLYFDGSLVSWSGSAPSPSSGQNLYATTATVHTISTLNGVNGSYLFEGLLAQTTLLDNIAADMTPGGDFLTGTGGPKDYAGSYGTNGFHLDYEASGALGDDVSGNNNDFTITGTPAQSSDVPT